MRILLSIVLVLLVGCASLQPKAQVSFSDRNGDGKIDLETHHYPKMADADWELRDDDYDGRYERRALYGLARQESQVDLPVPSSPHPKGEK